MKTLQIVYYSATGGGEAMARAASDGARGEEDIAVRLTPAGECDPEAMLHADGYLFVCPENLAAIAGGMKIFLDAAYYPLLGRIEGRPYAAMICAGSDGSNAARQLERIATGWRLRKVADTIIVNVAAQTPAEILAPKTIAADERQRCADMGAALATGIALGVF